MSPVQQIIESGVVPYFIRFSQIDDNPTLKLEANWALINIITMVFLNRLLHCLIL